MRRLIRLSVRLYPPWWRQRYEEEVVAVLAALQPGWREFLGVLKGAMAMHIRHLGAIPVLFALAGILLGALAIMRAPVLYASSATLAFNTQPGTNSEAVLGTKLQRTLSSAMAA